VLTTFELKKEDEGNYIPRRLQVLTAESKKAIAFRDIAS
jgi:hypothetical protein